MPEETEHIDNSRLEKSQRIAALLTGYMRGTLTYDEHDELDEWVGASEKNIKLFEELTDVGRIKKGLEWLDPEHIPQLLQRLDKEMYHHKSSRVWRRKSQYLVVASFLLVPIISVCILVKNKSEENDRLASLIKQPKALPNNDPYKAVLTLADGRIIILNQAEDGDLAIQGATSIVKRNGLLKYTHAIESAGIPALYNELITPRASAYTLTLPDGTKAWLNAESYIRFPTAFNGKERRVSISGEVYFEVAENSRQPFIVETKGSCSVKSDSSSLQVNINAYEDETKITLLKGNAQVSTSKKIETLQAGQQVNISKNSVRVSRLSNTKSATGWKDGNVYLLNVDLATFMRYIGRYFDFDVSYENDGYDKSLKYCFLFSREQPQIRNLLYFFERNGSASFKIEGKKIRVIPQKIIW